MVMRARNTLHYVALGCYIVAVFLFCGAARTAIDFIKDREQVELLISLPLQGLILVPVEI